MKTRLLTPGPTPVPEAVRLTLAMDMVHHRKQGFTALLAEVQKGLHYLFQTSQPVLPLTCSGTGAMDAAVNNLFTAKDKVLVIVAGKFGQRFSAIASRAGLDVVELSVPEGKAVTLGHVQDVLATHPDVQGILVQAAETSTGVLHPVQELARYTSSRDILLVVDGISAVGISPCPMDAWEIDCLLTGSQKGLMLPPGLAFICLSPRAWKRVEQKKARPFYFDLQEEKKRCLANGQTHFTPAINLLMGLHTCLEIFLEQSLETLFARQYALTCLAREGLKAMGLHLLVKEHYTWGLTSVCLPDSIDAGAVLRDCAARYGVVMAGGQGALKGKIIRLGHMGYVDYGDILAGLHALASCLKDHGHTDCSSGYLEAALHAYEHALHQPPRGGKDL